MAAIFNAREPTTKQHRTVQNISTNYFNEIIHKHKRVNHTPNTNKLLIFHPTDILLIIIPVQTSKLSDSHKLFPTDKPHCSPLRR